MASERVSLRALSGSRSGELVGASLQDDAHLDRVRMGTAALIRVPWSAAQAVTFPVQGRETTARARDCNSNVNRFSVISALMVLHDRHAITKFATSNLWRSSSRRRVTR